MISPEFYAILLNWMKSLGTAGTLDTICSGRDAALCLHHIDPHFFPSSWLQSTQQIDADADFRVKVSNVRKVYRKLSDYYDEVLGRNLRGSEKWAIDASKIAEFQDHAQIEKLLVLLFSAATLGPNSNGFVDQLPSLQLPMAIQTELMKVISEINSDMPPAHMEQHSTVANNDRVGELETDCSKLKTRIESYQKQVNVLTTERDDLANQLTESSGKLANLEVARMELLHENSSYKQTLTELKDKIHHYEDDLDLKESQILQLNNEISRCNEVIQRFESSKADELIQHLRDEKISLATQVQVLSDKLEAAELNLTESEGWRSKLKENNTLRSENKVLREKLETYIATAVAFDDEKRKNEVLKVQFEQVKLHLSETEQKLTSETVKMEQAMFDLNKVRRRLEEVEDEKNELLKERIHLRSELKSQSPPTLDKDLEMSGHDGSTLEPLPVDEQIDIQLKHGRLELEHKEVEARFLHEKEDLERQILELSTELRISKEKISQLENEANSAQKLYESSKASVEDRIQSEQMSVTVTRLERELRDALSTVDSLRNTVGDLKGELASQSNLLESEKRSLHEYLEKAHAAISDLEHSSGCQDPLSPIEYKKLLNVVKAKDKMIADLKWQLDTSRVLNEQEQRLLTTSCFKIFNERHQGQLHNCSSPGQTHCHSLKDTNLNADDVSSVGSQKWSTFSPSRSWILILLIAVLIPAMMYLFTSKSQKTSGILSVHRGAFFTMEDQNGVSLNEDIPAEITDIGGEEINVKLHENQFAPLVILFGWAGCQDRYLSKYSQIYENQCSVVRFTAPISRIRSFASYRTMALDIYEKVLDQYPTSVPIIFHLFSMNGCSLFTALWDLLDTIPNGSECKRQTVGIIFDSSPANVTPWQGANAVSLATLPPSAYGSAMRQSYRVLLATAFSLHRLTIWLRSQWEPNVYEHNFAFFRLRAMPDLPLRQLFLYSKNDEICSSKSIEDFISATSEAQKGLKIETKCWFNSPHCQHLRHHNDEYIQQCRRFSSDCFRQVSSNQNKGI